jgi:N-acetylneuraminic acid mutarotase
MKRNIVLFFGLLCLLILLTTHILNYHQWKTLTAMPSARTEMASVAANNEIYIIGGYSHPDSLALVEKYAPKLDQWFSLKEFPAKLDHLASVSYGNYIYVIGGLDHAETGAPSNNVFRYSINEDKWDEVSPLPKALGSVGAVLIGTTIHTFGGLNQQNSTSSHFSYNITLNEWHEELPMPFLNDHMAIATDGIRVFITGGRETFPDSFLSHLYIYDTHAKSWQKGPPLPTPRGDAQGAIVGDYFIVAGGENSNGKVFDVVEAFDIHLMTWKKRLPMSIGRHGHAAISSNNALYIIGGRDPNPYWGYTNLNEKLFP